MIEIGTIVGLENGKRYMITDSSIVSFKTIYLALEVDEDDNPKLNSMFFEDLGDHLLPITAEGDMEFLKSVFVDKFIDENIDTISDGATV